MKLYGNALYLLYQSMEGVFVLWEKVVQKVSEDAVG